MPHESSSDQEQDDSETEFVEVDPTGRYGRYREILGEGAFKKVYRGFDELEGIEVAWNQVRLALVMRKSDDLERLYSEIHLLKTLKHKNIIRFYNSWVDSKNEHINIITEIFTSGTLRQYRKKHKHVDLRALKKWSKQILEGLLYLHSHDPPVIHRDLKCDNVFVNGNQGEVKIGDLGLAAVLSRAKSAHSVLGTPEFMAPELYEEDYNELVDIYAFGLCLLELVTVEYPYVECANPAQIYKKVTSGIKPASLQKVTDPSVRAFIEKCIAKVSERRSAKELLMDPFLLSEEEKQSLDNSLQIRTQASDKNYQNVVDQSTQELSPRASLDFTVEGQRKDQNTIFLKLRIADSTGLYRNIHFPFDIDTDTATSVASEMVEELDLTDQDVSTIAEMIEAEIRSNMPGWSPTRETSSNNLPEEVSRGCDNHNYENTSELPPTLNEQPLSPTHLALERLPSGRKYWSDSPKAIGRSSPLKPGPLNLSSQVDCEKNEDDLEELNLVEDDASVEQSNDSPADSQACPSTWNSGTGMLSPAKSEVDVIAENLESLLSPSESEAKVLAEELELLLAKQQSELDELKRRHKLAISDFLKTVCPERSEVLALLKINIPDC